MLKPFRVLQPTSIRETCSELGRLGDGARVYAGGAELIPLIRYGALAADYLIDVKCVPQLAALDRDNGSVRIGAAATHRVLEHSGLIREQLPAFADAESDVGNVRVRTQGTVGGNLCFADPHSDPPTALLMYESLVTVAAGESVRSILLDDFLLGPFETALAPDQLLTEIVVPTLPAGWTASFRRIEQFYRPTVNAAVAIAMGNDCISAARLVVGCIGPRATRLRMIEEKIIGLRVPEAVQIIANSKPHLQETLDPVDDLLGSAAYKLHLATVVLARALADAAADNQVAHG